VRRGRAAEAREATAHQPAAAATDTVQATYLVLLCSLRPFLLFIRRCCIKASIAQAHESSRVESRPPISNKRPEEGKRMHYDTTIQLLKKLPGNARQRRRAAGSLLPPPLLTVPLEPSLFALFGRLNKRYQRNNIVPGRSCLRSQPAPTTDNDD